MTHQEYLSRQIDLDELHLNAADWIVAAGCLVVTALRNNAWNYGMNELMRLVDQAKALAGTETTCQVGGHDWQTDGGRQCPTGNDRCSQPVFVCARCGEQDYGDDEDGPGKTECMFTCGDSMTGWRSDWLEKSHD